MRQLTLDIHPDAPPTLDNFVVGENAALIDAIEHALIGAGHLYVWGPDGSGRSHLLQAAVTAAIAANRPGGFVAASTCGQALPADAGLLLAVDDIDRLSPDAQIALFNRFNAARERRQTLLLSGPCPPRDLRLREDLRTRVGQCLIFELRPLDDATRREILETHANRRGLIVPDDVIEFMLRHGRRDLPTLLHVLDALDRASLERKRAVTLPLLRELIQAGLPF